MSEISELSELDATDQADLVRRGELKAAELVESALTRIDRVNPQLNAVIHSLADKARATSAARLPEGPFSGVPFLVKDAVCHTAGDPYHLGMSYLKERGNVARDDTELARRFRAAGFVFVGKTNTPELALSATTEPRAYGATHNPWRPETSPGGSSGGSAAAVAAGLVPAAHANDMGGSIREPASFCGVVGLKPSRARGTLAPHLGQYWGPLTHEHVVTRTVRDSAAVLDAIAGPELGDPYSAPPPSRPWRDEVGADPGRLRVALVDAIAGHAVAPECAAAVERTARDLERLGHVVEPLDYEALSRPEIGPWIACAIAHELDRWAERMGDPIGPDDVEPFNWLMAEIGRAYTGPQYVAAEEAAFAWARELMVPWRAGFDIVITPTSPVLPPPLGWMAPDVPLRDLAPRVSAATMFTIPFDVTGQPAISLPLAESADGLPIGVQLVAAPAREDMLFRVSAQLEAATPWSGRRPLVHA